jgi:hypothetical protein
LSKTRRGGLGACCAAATLHDSLVAVPATAKRCDG